MRPVTLSRVLEVAYLTLCEQKLNGLKVAISLGINKRRASEILKEMVTIGLFTFENEYYIPTPDCENFLNYIKNRNLEDLHELLLKYPYYNSFYTTLKLIEPATKNQILENIKISDLHFNNVSIDVLCDWGERIESIQRNVFTNQYYSTSNMYDNITHTFLEVYNELNVKINLFMSKRYVEIPKVRETVCQRLNMKRHNFDELFKEMYLKNIESLELTGAPITTEAKKTSKKIKKNCFSEVANNFSVKFSSNMYLNGVTIDGRVYYYIAYHGGNLNG